VPLGIGAAIFLAELAPARISDTLQFFIDLLAAVPSVIYGLLGVFIVVPMVRTVIYPALNGPFGYLPVFKGPSYGVGFLTAGIVLAIMVIPYIISVSREVLLSVPRDQREAALALGSTRWESTWKVVVPFGHYGIDFSGTRTRIGRDHGRDHGDRQHTENCGLAICTGVFDRGSDCERVHGSHG
jgi:phosphate transport system permease protein